MFILKVKNKRTGQIEQSDFKTEIERNNHLDNIKKSGYIRPDPITINHPETDGIPAYQEVIPAEHEIEVLDTTAQEEFKRAKFESRETKRQLRVTKFKSVDWSKVKTVAELKEITEALVSEVLKDEE